MQEVRQNRRKEGKDSRALRGSRKILGIVSECIASTD